MAMGLMAVGYKNVFNLKSFWMWRFVGRNGSSSDRNEGLYGKKWGLQGNK